MGVPPGSRNVRTKQPMLRNRSASKPTCVDLPQPSVPSNVMKSPFISKLLQLRSLGRVLDRPAFGFQLVTDGVRAFEIFGLLGRGALLGERLDFRRDFRFRPVAYAENRIHLFP